MTTTEHTFEVLRDHPKLNVETREAKTRNHYRVPILVSLLELGPTRTWSSGEIKSHWRSAGYITLNGADHETDGDAGTRMVWDNRHAFALVALQQADFIENQHGEYRITDAGLHHLEELQIIRAADNTSETDWVSRVEEFLKQEPKAYTPQWIAEEIADGQVQHVQSALNTLRFEDDTVERRFVDGIAYYAWERV